jgi:hypothetical protein
VQPYGQSRENIPLDHGPGRAIDSGLLKTMSRKQLSDIYRAAQPGKVPTGAGRPTAMILAGQPLDRPLQALISRLWHAKVFDPENGKLHHLIASRKMINGRVYMGDSMSQAGGKAIIIDFRKTGFPFWFMRPFRDELREVAPGLYLGRSYLRLPQGFVFFANFMLDFSSPSAVSSRS